MLRLKIQKIHDDSVIPTKSYVTDLGWDLYAYEHTTIHPGGYELISTGIRCGFPEGYGAFFKDRSSVAKRGLFVRAGVIDGDYVGELMILMYNAGDKIQHINKGDRLAQMVLIPIVNCSILEVDELKPTERGEGGFGSTGA